MSRFVLLLAGPALCCALKLEQPHPSLERSSACATSGDAAFCDLPQSLGAAKSLPGFSLIIRCPSCCTSLDHNSQPTKDSILISNPCFISQGLLHHLPYPEDTTQSHLPPVHPPALLLLQLS